MPIAGKFITFEGGEGAGKSTQLTRLAERLRTSGAGVLSLREPGGTPFGEKMRDVLKQPGSAIQPAAEALLFAACRAQLVTDVIAPALAAGQAVLCDRFIDSTVAYQSGGRGLERTLVESANRLACGAVRPDLTILLDLDPSRGLGRASVRDHGQPDRFEVLGADFHRKVRDLYHALAKEEPARFFVVDAARPPEEVEQEIWHEIARRFR
ncbi:MAG: dTMP kinase [Verrucomicrobia bacterium]|nr:dTMP kinase [Verrucomicrobiota bacterium]